MIPIDRFEIIINVDDANARTLDASIGVYSLHETTVVVELLIIAVIAHV